jgi:hypothetical protein
LFLSFLNLSYFFKSFAFPSACHSFFVSTMVQNEDPGQQQPERIRRTHISDRVVAMLKTLLLPDKLKKNKEIDERNQLRRLKMLNHELDPVAHPDTGSEQASLITLDSDDMEELRKPSIFERFKSQLTDALYSTLSEEFSKKRSGDSLTSVGEKRQKIHSGEKEATQRSLFHQHS